MKKKVCKLTILISVFVFLVSCNNISLILAQTNSQEIISIAPIDNVYIQKTYELGSFEKLPKWAGALKQIDSENSYVTKIYTNNFEYRDLVDELFEDNEIVFEGMLNEQTIFDKNNILVVARRLDDYLYSPYCSYTNACFENQTNYIDINYGSQYNTVNSNVIYLLDFLAIEKDSLLTNYKNFVINQKYYKNVNKETKKVESFKSICVEVDHDADFKAGAKIFNYYKSFCNYVNEYTDLEVKTFFDRSWFKNNYAIVVLRTSNIHGIMCYEDIDIKSNNIILTCYNVSGGALAFENYVDIILVPKHKLGIISTIKKYDVEYKVNYYGL